MVATSGDRLLAQDAVEAIRRLLPLASLITPNLDEAADLLRADRAVDVTGMLEQGRQLLALGARRVLIKGGHLPETSAAIDVFVSPELEQVLSTPRISTTSTHGTGCTLSSAIAALRPQRGSWLEAVTDAKHWLTRRDRRGAGAGGGARARAGAPFPSALGRPAPPRSGRGAGVAANGSAISTATSERRERGRQPRMTGGVQPAAPRSSRRPTSRGSHPG